MIGIRNSTYIHQVVRGFAPMKDGVYLNDYIRNHVHGEKNENWNLTDKYHFGGFGKWNRQLLGFMNDFYSENKVRFARTEEL